MSKAKKVAKAYRRRVRAIQRQLADAGISARMEAVRKAITDEMFVEQLRLAIMTTELERPLRSAEEVRALALDLIQSKWVTDISGVSLKVEWNPTTSYLGLRVVPDAVALMSAARAVDEKPDPPTAPAWMPGLVPA